MQNYTWLNNKVQFILLYTMYLLYVGSKSIQRAFVHSLKAKELVKAKACLKTGGKKNPKHCSGEEYAVEFS